MNLMTRRAPILAWLGLLLLAACSSTNTSENASQTGGQAAGQTAESVITVYRSPT